MRILIVEDNEEVRAMVKKSFEAESFAVDEANNGEDGLALAKANDYDALILDLLLPKRDGYTICKEVRTMGKSVPIIMLSVHSSVESKVDILNDGADDYLTKPFSFNELLARTRALIRRPRSLQPDLMKVDDIEIDTQRQRVFKNKKLIYLTRKEYCLLEYLARHKGKVVSRSSLLEHVWSSDGNPFSNTVEAHILNLRKKIDAGNKKKILRTVPARGYIFDDSQPS